MTRSTVRLRISLVMILLGCAACAQVPKEAIELSTTVGRDVAEVHRAHRATATLLFARIKRDVNRLVDEVYAPFQIQKQLAADHADFKAGSEESMFAALNAALKKPDSAEDQEAAIATLEIFVEVIRGDIEDYRSLRLAPVLQQERDVLEAIDRSYNQIHYANSIVTGHLASVAKVHDAQEEVLRDLGLEGLRGDIGAALAETSDKVARILDKARKFEGKVDEVESKIEEITSELDKATGGSPG